ncbi:RNA polymerase sigma factor [Fulvivirgaceae bacterium BMA10]|uniref:RNA polymerase sigma factor n=1 Tax=Splendidivirga corallicola TaxID=3051826 RepID=A0ABT8KUN8_9BACT|nr:RNA polymerase sigma factor [Fulvivirgaceae bacterium BMA10]
MEDKELISSTIKSEEKRLFHFIRKLVPQKEDAEDILQDVFYQLILGISEIRQVERVSAWLHSIAKNKVIDWYRKKRPLNFSKLGNGNSQDSFADVLRDYAPLQHDELWKEAVWDTIELALEELPTEQREVFIWHELEDKSFKEISTITGEGTNTLLSRKRYAVLHLRKRLEQLYNELKEI